MQTLWAAAALAENLQVCFFLGECEVGNRRVTEAKDYGPAAKPWNPTACKTKLSFFCSLKV